MSQIFQNINSKNQLTRIYRKFIHTLEKKESNLSNFDEIKKQVESIFDDPEDVKAVLANRVDDSIKFDVKNRLEIKNKLKMVQTFLDIQKIKSEEQANRINEFDLGYFVGSLDITTPKKPVKNRILPKI